MTVFLAVLVDGLVLASVYYIVSLGLNLIFGVLDIVNFAHGAFVIVGAYITYYLWTATGMSPWLLLPITGVGCAVLGVILYWFYLRLTRNDPLVRMVGLLGVASVIASILLAIGGSQFFAVNDHSAVIHITDAGFTADQFIGVGVSIALGLATGLFLQKTRYGRAIRAVIDDRTALRFCGINDEFVSVVAFALGSALAGIGGAVVSTYITFGADSGTNFVVIAFSIIVLGGLGDFVGVGIAAILVGMLESVVGTYWQASVGQIVLVGLVIVSLVARPRGILGRGRV